MVQDRCEETGHMVRVVAWEIKLWISNISLKVIIHLEISTYGDRHNVELLCISGFNKHVITRSVGSDEQAGDQLVQLEAVAALQEDIHHYCPCLNFVTSQ